MHSKQLFLGGIEGRAVRIFVIFGPAFLMLLFPWNHWQRWMWKKVYIIIIAPYTKLFGKVHCITSSLCSFCTPHFSLMTYRTSNCFDWDSVGFFAIVSDSVTRSQVGRWICFVTTYSWAIIMSGVCMCYHKALPTELFSDVPILVVCTAMFLPAGVSGFCFYSSPASFLPRRPLLNERIMLWS